MSSAASGDTAPGEVVDVAGLERWLRRFAAQVGENSELLTRLDAAIGDADHGANLDRGMTAVVTALDGTALDGTAPDGAADVTSDAAMLLKRVGMTLVSTVGGASGPLYGTLFLRMATAAGAVRSLDARGFAAALRAGLDGVVARGKAQPGDKTLFDALAPACDALEAGLDGGSGLAEALAAAADAAEAGRDATTPMLARKGRASYLGERSVGYQDPGATSMAMLVRAAAEVLLIAVG